MEKPCRVFCCYASEDEAFLQDLKKHLMPLQREGSLIVQADIDISPGKEWEREIDHYLKVADIILLLISADFMNSDRCFDEMMQQAIARHQQGTVRVVPIIIRPTDWQETPFGVLQSLPRGARPVSMWLNKDEAFVNVVGEIRAIVREFTTNTRGCLSKEDRQWLPAKEDPVPDSGQGKHDTNTGKYNFGGPVHAKIIGDNVHIGNINNIYGGRKDGISSLEKGSKALWSRDYPSAKKELHIAFEEIDGEGQPREASKVRYFLALALLGGKLPRTQGKAVIQSIEAFMNEAITMHPCASYYQIFARIEEDFFKYNGFDQRLKEISALENKGAYFPRYADDEENEEYFRHCQPRL